MNVVSRVRRFVRPAVPDWLADAIRRLLQLPRHGFGDRRQRFTRIYRSNYWEGSESRSGVGSTAEMTTSIRERLPDLLHRYEVTSVLDAGCGDFNWMSRVDLKGVDYVGVEIVVDLVEENRRRHGTEGRRFECLDVVHDLLPRCDLVLCRDVLYHLSHRDILAAIANFSRSGATYLLTTTYPETTRNVDIVTGAFHRLNLQLPPFSFPPPLETLEDSYSEVMGLWRLADLEPSAAPGSDTVATETKRH